MKKNEQKKRKKRGWAPSLRLTVFFLSLAVLAGSLTVLIAGGLKFGIIPPEFFDSFRIISKESRSVSYSRLEEVKDLFVVSTTSHTYKLVFPWDFIPPEEYWEPLKEKYARGEVLNEQEEHWLQVYELAEKIGIGTGKQRYDFAVVSATVTAGFDLSAYAPGQEETPAFAWQSDGILYITLPDPEILSVVIEDDIPEEYRYPDLDISPENWKILTDFVSGRVIELAQENRLLEQTTQRGRDLAQAVFGSGPWERIVFTRPDQE